MRSTWKRAFAALLTIAMLASLLVVPAAAEVTAEGGVFTLDFSTEWTSDEVLSEAKTAGTEKADGTPYFTVGSSVDVKTGQSATFDDDADYTATAYGHMGSGLSASNVKVDKNCISFTTINNKASIKVWWGRTKVKKGLAIFSGPKDNAASFYAAEATSSSATETYVTTVTAGDAGLYAVGVVGDASGVEIYKVEVTDMPADPDAVDVTMEQTTASVLEGGTVTLSARKAPEDATLAWSSSKDDVASIVDKGDGTCEVTGVSAGTATITATVSKDGQTPVTGECEVTVYGKQNGILHFLSTDSKLILPTTTEEKIAVGKNGNVSGYAFELYGSPTVGTESGKTGDYKGTTLSHVLKLTGGGKGFSFMAPEAGTLTLYFADAEDNATVKYAEDDGTLTESSVISATAPFTITTKAGSIYKIEKGTGKCWATHFIWTASDYACEHEWSETAVTVGDEEVYYCTNPVCLETKPVEEGGNVAAKAVETVLAAIGGGATDATANFEASKGSLDTSDEEALNRFVVDALIAKMGATYAQQVEFEVTKAEYTDLSAATSLLADGEVKVGEIAYEVTVLAKDDNSDTADIAGTIDVMAAEGGDEPDPGKTYIAAGTYNFVKSAATPADTAIENAGGALTWTDVSYQNNSNNDMHGPKATAGTSAVKVATDPDKYTTLILTGCQYGTKTAPTATGATIEAVGTAGSDPVYYVFNAQGDVTFTLHAGDFIHSIEALVIDTPVTLYTVGAAKVDNGTVTVSPAGKVPAGTEITVTTSAASGYELDESSLKYGATAITGGKFTMPAENTEVTATFESADIGEVAAGTYNYLDDWQTAPKAAGFEWGAGMTRPASKDHGVKAETGNGPATLKLHLTDTATVYVELCGYNNSSVVSDQIVGGTTVTGATDSTWTVLKNDGNNPPNSYALKFVNVTADTDGVATLTFSNSTFIHAVKVVYEETVVKTDLAEKTVTLKKGETALGDTAPVVDDVLTASVEGVAAADVEFIWTVGGTQQTGKGATYTVKAADMDKTISVKAAAPAASTKYTGETAAVTTAVVKGKTMTGVSAANVTATYNGQPKQIEVKGAPAGATVTYCDTQNGEYKADAITITNVADSPKTVYYKVTAEGYETFSGSATITVNKAPAPDISFTVVNDEIPSEGRTVTFTVKGIPASSKTAPTAVCDQAAAGATISFTKEGTDYKGTNVVTASEDGAARTHIVTMTWADPNYETVTKTKTLHQLAQGAVIADEATGLAAWDGVDYAALGIDAAVSAEDNAVTLTIDEAKILDAYAKDAETFKGGSMNHGGNAYMMIQFEAPADVDTAKWTVKQTVNNGAESDPWKLDGTGGDLDCWTVGDKTYIGDWFGVLMGVEGTAQTMPEENTYVMRYNFYDDSDTLVAAIKYTVVRHVVEAVDVSVAANTDLDPVAAFKTSPSEELTLTVAVKDGVDKVLPETITVTLNGEAMAAADYTWDKTTGKVTIAAAQLTAGDAIVITVAPAAKPADKTELNAAITAATTKKAGVETSADGKDIAKDKTWVTTAVMNDLNEKLTAAQTVADKTNATQTEVDEAKAALVAATTAFAPAAGLKDEGGNTPGGDVKVLNIADEVAAGRITVTGDANTAIETDTAGLGTDGFFTIMPKSSNGLIEPGKNVDFGDGYTGTVAYKTGGGMTVAEGDTGRLVKFTTTGESTVKVWWTSASAGCLLNLKDATGADLFKEEGDGHPTSGADSIVVTVIENVPADTECYLGGTKGVRFYKIEVSPAVGGGVTVDKTALTAALAAAKAIDTTAVKTSADGADVPTTEKWVTPAVKDALTKAIADAEKLGESATQTEVEAAAKALTDAVAAWNPADGLKTEGGEPTKPADKTALQTAITNAEKKVPADIYVVGDDTKVSAVDYGTKFMTESDKDTYDKALAAAKALLAKDDATQAEVDAAVAALNKAAGKVKNGTKGAPAPSGGSTSRGDDASATGTETKADGSVVTTTTDRQGNKTVVTQRPDGSKITAVTKADGTVTIAATNADGETVADVKVPGTMPTNPQRFVDVPDEHWAAKSINDMAVLGVVRGVDDVNHIFDMKSDITRGSVATILFRFSNGKAGLENIFSDVAEGKWYTDGVAWASKVGVVNGFEDGTFRPENSITRAQLATMIARYAKIIGLDTTTNGDLSAFVDGASVQSWAVDGMAWCVANGIVNGRGNNTLAPNASASRAEAAAMFDRFVQLLK